MQCQCHRWWWVFQVDRNRPSGHRKKAVSVWSSEASLDGRSHIVLMAQFRFSRFRNVFQKRRWNVELMELRNKIELLKQTRNPELAEDIDMIETKIKKCYDRKWNKKGWNVWPTTRMVLQTCQNRITWQVSKMIWFCTKPWIQNWTLHTFELKSTHVSAARSSRTSLGYP